MDDLKDIISKLQANDPELTSVSLFRTEISDADAQKLANALETNTVANEIDFTYCDWTDEGATILAGALKKMKEIWISKSPISDQSLTSFADLIRGNKELTFFAMVATCDPSNPYGEGMEAFANALKNNETMTKLNFTFNSINGVTASKLAKELKENNALEELDLYDNTVDDEGAIALANAVKEMAALQILRLSGNKISDTGAIALAKAMEKNKNLEIALSHNSIADEGAMALAEAYKRKDHLTSISLSFNNIKARGTKALATVIADNKVPITLAIAFNPISDDGLMVLLEEYKKGTCIIEDFRGLRITDEGAKRFAEVLIYKPDLQRYIELGYNEIADEGATELAISLKTNKTVESLNLYDNSIGDLGAKSLATMIKFNSCIKDLSLSRNSIGNEGAQALAKSLESNEVLESLDLSENSITDQTILDTIKQYLDRNSANNKKKGSSASTINKLGLFQQPPNVDESSPGQHSWEKGSEGTMKGF